MTEKTLYILRHGETLFNLTGRTQGWCDSPLSKRGVEQCRRAGQALARRGVRFDHAYCSTAERCSDTLEIVTGEAFGRPMEYGRLKDLREISYGSCEGTRNYREVRDAVLTPSFEAIGGGESADEAVARFQACLERIMARDDHHQVLVVSSGGISMQFYYANLAYAEVVQTIFSNCLAYVYAWDAGIFRCHDIFAPDLADLESPDLPPQLKRVELGRA